MTSSADVNAQLPSAIPKVDAPDLDYEIASFGHGLKAYVRRLQENGDNKLTIQASQTEAKFRIPAGTYNFSKSFLRYAWEPENASSAGGDPTHYAQWSKEDVIPIFSIRLATQEGGIVMTELIYADQYVKRVQKAETTLSKFLTQNQLDPFYPCDELATANLVGVGTQAGSRNYLETKYSEVSAVDTKLPVVDKLIYLNTFKNTLFDLDKTVYYPEPMELSIMFQSRDHWYHEATSIANASTGARAATQDV